jgi:hypothetical protein
LLTPRKLLHRTLRSALAMEWQLLKAMRKDWNERLTIHFIYQYYIFLECGLGKIVFNTSCASAAPQGRNDFKIKNFVAREPLPGRVRNPDLDAGAKRVALMRQRI